MFVLGGDPGKTGAIVGLQPGPVKLVVVRAPHAKSAKGRGEEILYSAMWEDFKRLLTESPTVRHAFIERVQAMKGQGGSSMFKFGYSAGYLRGIVTACGIPITMVEPQKWKAYAKIPLGADKEVSLARACELFPQSAELFVPKRNSWTKEECIGVADAALIAYYGLSTLPATSAEDFDI